MPPLMPHPSVSRQGPTGLSKRRSAVFTSLACGLAVLALVALALPASAGPKEEARALNDQGTALLKAEDYAGARGKFEAAYALFQHEVIALNVALTALHLGQPEQAFDWLWGMDEASLNEKTRAKWQKIYDVARKELSATKGILRLDELPGEALVFIDGQKIEGLTAKRSKRWLSAGAHNVVVIADGKQSQVDVAISAGIVNPYAVRFEEGLVGTVIVETPVAGALLFVDGRNYGEVRGEGVELSPGEYKLTVRAAGYREYVARVRVASSRITKVKAALKRVGGEPVSGTKAAASKAGLRAPGLWAWVTMGSGLALFSGGVGLNIMVANAASDLDSRYSKSQAGDLSPADASYLSGAEYKAAWDSDVSGQAPLVYGLYGVGATALITGATLWLLGVEGFTADDGTQVGLHPIPMADGLGLGLHVVGF